ncbi:MAG: hypothetical protein GY861_00240 [bacterium]|nr:hypothetical protein [bacterium]
MKATINILLELSETQDDLNDALITYIDLLEDETERQNTAIEKLERVVGYHQDVIQQLRKDLSTVKKTYELLAG